jgi:hypothetical protein
VRGCRSIRACAKAGGRSPPRSRRGSCAPSGAPTRRYAVYRAWKNLNEVRENPSRW